jgi:hypothetical protein
LVHNSNTLGDLQMNFFKIAQNPHAPVHIIVTDISDKTQHGEGWVYMHDFKSFEQAFEVAEAASKFAGVDYIATESNGYFEVIQAPQILDLVSYYFNGDSYPCGHIKSISKTMKKITTNEGKVFYRRKLSGSWVMNNTWSMISGHHYEQNPHL